MEYSKYTIIARSIIIFLILLIVGFCILRIFKKKWIWLLIHVIISLIIIRFFVRFSRGFSCISGACDMNGNCGITDGFCAITEEFNRIFHPIKDGDIRTME